MKNIFKLSLSVMLVFFVLYSCKTEEDENINRLNINEFTYIGQSHNEALDLIKINLEKIGSQKSTMSEDEIIQFMIDNVTEYLSDKVFVVNGITVDEFPIPTLSEYKEMMNDIENGDKGDFEEYRNNQASISDIELIENLYKDGDDIENYTYLASASIFKNSIEYWSEGESKINWYSIAFADASGAYSGGAWGGVCGGPAGAVGGAISMGILNSALAGFVGSLGE